MGNDFGPSSHDIVLEVPALDGRHSPNEGL